MPTSRGEGGRLGGGFCGFRLTPWVKAIQFRSVLLTIAGPATFLRVTKSVHFSQMLVGNNPQACFGYESSVELALERFCPASFLISAARTKPFAKSEPTVLRCCKPNVLCSVVQTHRTNPPLRSHFFDFETLLSMACDATSLALMTCAPANTNIIDAQLFIAVGIWLLCVADSNACFEAPFKANQHVFAATCHHRASIVFVTL